MRFLHKNPELYGGAAGLSEPVKEKTGQTFFPSAWSSFSVEGDDLCAERAGYRYSRFCCILVIFLHPLEKNSKF